MPKDLEERIAESRIDPETLEARVLLDDLRCRLFAEERPGLQIGRFRVLGRLGYGALGAVYRGHDPDLAREVALKVLRGAFAEGAAERLNLRLRREAQVMARLKHPNVLTVYDLGTADGRVFVAMELAEAGTLRDWMRRGPHGWREVVSKLAEAGRGLMAAHALGVVHRDFKPENVFVGRDGRVRVGDFGLVRLGDLADAGYPQEKAGDPPNEQGSTAASVLGTLSGTALGTPAYMAPEQAAGQTSDARADQYSFCVVLWEALYGERPSADPAARSPPPRAVGPDRRRRRVPRRVRRALKRGLREDPGRRFPAMEYLVTELEGAHRGRSVPLWTLSLAGAAAVATVVWQWNGHGAARCSGGDQQLERAWNATRAAALESGFRRSTDPNAPVAGRLLREGLDRYGRIWKESYRDACEATHVRNEQSSGMLDMRMACLGRNRAELDALVSALSEGGTDLVRRAVEAAATLPPISQCADTRALIAEAPEPGDPVVVTEVARIREDLARIRALDRVGRYQEALAGARRIAEHLARASDAARPVVAAEAQHVYGTVESHAGDAKQGVDHLAEAYWTALARRDDALAARAAADIVTVSGQELNRFDEAMRWGRHARAIINRMGTGGFEDALLNTGMGRALQAHGDDQAAQQSFERALELWRRVLGPEHPSVARAIMDLGNSAMMQSRRPEAIAHFEHALTMMERTLGPHHPDLGEVQASLGIMRDRQGERNQALASYQRALAVIEGAYGSAHARTANVLTNIGILLDKRGQHAEALEHHRRAVRAAETSRGGEHALVGNLLVNLARSLERAGRHREAQESLERALAVWRQALGAEHPNIPFALVNLAGVLHKQDRNAEAMTHAVESLKRFEKYPGPDSPNASDSLTLIGSIHLASGRPAAALPLLERSVRNLSSSKDLSRIGQSKFGLAQALWSAGADRERARSLAREAREALRGAGGDPGELAAVEAWLGRRTGA